MLSDQYDDFKIVGNFVYNTRTKKCSNNKILYKLLSSCKKIKSGNKNVFKMRDGRVFKDILVGGSESKEESRSDQICMICKRKPAEFQCDNEMCVGMKFYCQDCDIHGNPVFSTHSKIKLSGNDAKNLVIVIDCTSSMGTFLESTRNSLKHEINPMLQLTDHFNTIKVIAYWDHGPGDMDTGAVKIYESIEEFAENVIVVGHGNDVAEASKAALMEVPPNSYVIHITDAPPHTSITKAHQTENENCTRERDYFTEKRWSHDWTDIVKTLQQKHCNVSTLLAGYGGFTYHKSVFAANYIYLAEKTNGFCSIINKPIESLTENMITKSVIRIILAMVGYEINDLNIAHYVPKEIDDANDEMDPRYFYTEIQGMDFDTYLTNIIRQGKNPDVEMNAFFEQGGEQLEEKPPQTYINYEGTVDVKSRINMASLITKFKTDIRFQGKVHNTIKSLIEAGRIMCLTYNPIYGKLWRLLMSKGAQRDELARLMQIKQKQYLNDEELLELKQWNEESFSAADEIQELIQEIPQGSITNFIEIPDGIEIEQSELINLSRNIDNKCLSEIWKIIGNLKVIIPDREKFKADRSYLPICLDDPRLVFQLLPSTIFPEIIFRSERALTVMALMSMKNQGLIPYCYAFFEQFNERNFIKFLRDKDGNLILNERGLPRETDVAGNKITDDLAKSPGFINFMGDNLTSFVEHTGISKPIVDWIKAKYRHLKIQQVMYQLELNKLKQISFDLETSIPVDLDVERLHGKLIMCPVCDLERSFTQIVSDDKGDIVGCGYCEAIEYSSGFKDERLEDNGAHWFSCGDCNSYFVASTIELQRNDDGVLQLDENTGKPRIGKRDKDYIKDPEKRYCHYCRNEDKERKEIKCTSCTKVYQCNLGQEHINPNEFVCTFCYNPQVWNKGGTFGSILRYSKKEIKQFFTNKIDEELRGNRSDHEENAESKDDGKTDGEMSIIDHFVGSGKVLKWKNLKIQNTKEVLQDIIELSQKINDECGICFDTFSVKNLVPVCGNCFNLVCRECFKQHWSQLKFGGLIMDSQTKCPYCRQFPSLKMIQRNRLNCTLAIVPQFKKMAAKGLVDDKVYYASCVTCKKIQPALDKNCAEQGTPNIENWQCSDCKVFDPGELAGGKACPYCNVYILKDGGCNHITCPPPCNKHWCYDCAYTKDEIEILPVEEQKLDVNQEGYTNQLDINEVVQGKGYGGLSANRVYGHFHSSVCKMFD